MSVRAQVLTLVALTGCGSEAARPADSPTCDLGRRSLALSHERLAFDGQTTMEVTGADPGEAVTFWWTHVEGLACTCPEGLDGCLELDAPERIGGAIADEHGRAVIRLALGADEPVGARWIQASTGRTLSAVLRGEVSNDFGRHLGEAGAHYRVQGDGLGGAIAAVGDLDGDGGYAFAAAAPDLGRVYLYRPTDGVRDRDPIDEIDDLAATVLEGPPGAGARMVGADVNGDGRADLVASDGAGTVWLVLGGLGTGPGVHHLDDAAADVLAGSGYGAGLAAADLDGDGRATIAIATPDRVLLSSRPTTLGADDSLLGLEAPRVAPAGDLDGDGLDDLAVASGDALHLYYGPGILESGLEAADAVVAEAGDLDGDGYDDVLAASPRDWAERGVVSVVYGPLHPVVPVLEGRSGERVGELVAGAGDVDGDGFADLVASLSDGTAVLLYGPAEGLRSTGEADVNLASDDPTRWVAALVGPGDIDGDRVDDLVMGTSSEETGGVYVFRGAPGW